MGACRARGTFPFVASLDHLGPFARSVGDLALAYDAMLGRDEDDPAQADVAADAGRRRALDDGRRGPAHREARRLFRPLAAMPALSRRSTRVARGARRRSGSSNLPGAERARAAAYLITMVEGAALHLERLRTARGDFDPDVRDRLIAGAMLPGAWVRQAQKFRRHFRDAGARALSRGRHSARAGDAVPRAEDRPEDLRARRQGNAGPAEYRRLHPADLLHRPAGRRRSGLDGRREAADRRAGHRAALARGSCARASRAPSSGTASSAPRLRAFRLRTAMS